MGDVDVRGTRIERRYRKAVFIAVYRLKNNAPDYLILKRKLHWRGWEFPKGGLKPGESLAQAAKREVYEETGSKPACLRKHNITGKFRYNREFADRKGIVGQTYALFSAKIPAQRKIKLDKIEHSAYLWLPFKKAVRKLKWQNQKKCLRIVNKSVRAKK